MFKITTIAVSLLTSAAFAQDAPNGGEVMVEALSAGCIQKLEDKSFSEGDMVRANTQVEFALLNGKYGRVWRTSDPRVVVVDFESNGACDVMGLQISAAEFTDALTKWRAGQGAAYTVSGDPILSQVDPDGVYFVRKTDAGDYIQVTVNSTPERKFIGITTTRVKESFEAREVLGEPDPSE